MSFNPYLPLVTGYSCSSRQLFFKAMNTITIIFFSLVALIVVALIFMLLVDWRLAKVCYQLK